jgi:hypothetical protein
LITDDIINNIKSDNNTSEYFSQIFNNPNKKRLETLSKFIKGKLVPVPKDPDTPNVTRLRPIVATSRIMKLVELVIHPSPLKRLMYQHINKRQTGFIPGLSCHEHITEMLNKIAKIRRTRKEGNTIFIDLKSVYDRVPRDLLIKK